MKCYTKMTRNHDIAPAGTGPRNPEQVASAEVAGSVLTSSDEHLRFERLISDLSARFVNITPDQVGREIENALKQIVEFFQVDRCGLLGTPRRWSAETRLPR